MVLGRGSDNADPAIPAFMTPGAQISAYITRLGAAAAVAAGTREICKFQQPACYATRIDPVLEMNESSRQPPRLASLS